MYSTKHLENILLAELGYQKQYKPWMKDSSRVSGKSFKEMKTLRSSGVFRQIFGNKQRIWLKLDIDTENNDSMKREYIRSQGVPGIIRYSIYNLIYSFYLLSENDLNIIDGLVSVYTAKLSENDKIDMYVNGYIINPITNKQEKMGKFYQKVINQLKKNKENIREYYPQIDKQIKNLEDEYKKFNLRKEEFKDNTRILDDVIVWLWSNVKLEWYACISRDPQDVGAMSTGQGWTSCQDLDKKRTKGKENESIQYNEWNWHTRYDVPKGTCIAYLMSNMAIKKSRSRFKPKTEHFPLLSPTARVNIKPFYNNHGEVYLSIGTSPRTYGKNMYTRVFVDTVQQYLESRQSNISGKFRIPRELYNEGVSNIGGNTVVVKNGKIVNVEGNVDMYKYDPKGSEMPVPENVRSLIFNFFDVYATDADLIVDAEVHDKDYADIAEYSQSFKISNSHLYNCTFEDVDVNITNYNKNSDYTSLFENYILNDMYCYWEFVLRAKENGALDIWRYIVNTNYTGRFSYTYISGSNFTNTTITFRNSTQNTRISETNFEDTNISEMLSYDFDVTFNNCYFQDGTIELIQSQNTDFQQYSGHNQYFGTSFTVRSVSHDIQFIGDTFGYCNITIDYLYNNNKPILLKFVGCDFQLGNEYYDVDIEIEINKDNVEKTIYIDDDFISQYVEAENEEEDEEDY